MKRHPRVVKDDLVDQMPSFVPLLYYDKRIAARRINMQLFGIKLSVMVRRMAIGHTLSSVSSACFSNEARVAMRASFLRAFSTQS